MKTRHRSVILGVGLAVLSLVAWVATPLRAAWRSTSHFLPHPTDPRVCFEAGAEKLAETVALALPAAIATVEHEHFGPFLKPVTIYVCATPKSIVAYGGSKNAGGFVLNGRVFISPKPQNTAERVPRLLVHELSHLHFEQRIGMIGFARNVPSWFKEGVAVLVSGGGGAESVSKSEARSAIAAGRTFDPATSGRLLFQQSGRSYGLAEHMWYRQSALLVEFLKDKDAAAFRRLVVVLSEGQRFGPAVEACYGVEFAALLREFRSLSIVISWPNKAPEPTPTAVTIPADAGLAPAAGVAHL